MMTSTNKFLIHILNLEPIVTEPWPIEALGDPHPQITPRCTWHIHMPRLNSKHASPTLTCKEHSWPPSRRHSYAPRHDILLKKDSDGPQWLLNPPYENLMIPF